MNIKSNSLKVWLISCLFLFGLSLITTPANAERILLRSSETNPLADIQFSAAEVKQHQQTLPIALTVARACMTNRLDRHQAFFKKWGISPYFGDNSDFSRLKLEDRKKYLVSLGLPESLYSELKPTSCIGFVMECMGIGFEQAGQAAIWNKLKTYVASYDYDGTRLQDALRKLGWKTYYWNPNISLNKVWDEQEQKMDPKNKDYWWGYHEYRWKRLQQTGLYYTSPVDDRQRLINFNTEPPKWLLKAPFLFGSAHTGYHIFAGWDGLTIEAHSIYPITSSRMIESFPFNPLLPNGGPTAGSYRSGLISIPPGYSLGY